jgi:NTE family protein
MIESRFNLVLSGGAALGYAHVGVVQRLYELDRIPQEIVGTSMGAIVGSAYALGLSKKDFLDLFDEFSNIFKWFRLSFSDASLIDNDKIYAILESVFGDMTVSQVPIPLKIVASNFNSGEIRIFCKDDDIAIKDAVLASMSIPALFPQVEIKGEFYVDGYLGANLGINHLSNSSIQTIAVDVMGLNSLAPYVKDKYSFFGHTKAIIKNMERAMRLMMINQTKMIVEDFQGELLLLQPNLHKFKSSHFTRYKKIKEVGYQSAVEILGNPTTPLS